MTEPMTLMNGYPLRGVRNLTDLQEIVRQAWTLCPPVNVCRIEYRDIYTAVDGVYQREHECTVVIMYADYEHSFVFVAQTRLGAYTKMLTWLFRNHGDEQIGMRDSNADIAVNKAHDLSSISRRCRVCGAKQPL